MKWADIPGFCNRYQVSDEGEVKRKAFKGLVGQVKTKSGLVMRYYPDHILAPKTTQRGLIVVLYDEDQRRLHVNVDYLVLSVFCGVEPFSQVWHLDGNIFNNHLTNLSWKKSGLIPEKECKYKKILSEQEVQKAFTDERSNAVVAQEIGISPLAVELIKRRVLWTQYTQKLARAKRYANPNTPFVPEINLEHIEDENL